jgi:hypothetical protein
MQGKSNKVIPVDCPLTKETYADLSARNPGYVFSYSTPLRRSTHPLCRVERTVYEEFLMYKLGQHESHVAIIDIGGCPPRHKIMGRKNVFSLCPNILEEDPARNLRQSQNATYKKCSCIFPNDCDHVRDFIRDFTDEYKDSVEEKSAVKDVKVNYVMIHSFYYIDPIDLIEHMIAHPKSRYGAVFHPFSEEVGTYGSGELIYSDQDGIVECLVRSSYPGETNQYLNNDFYRHPSLNWMKNGYLKHGDKYLTWCILKHDDMLQAVEFIITDRPPRELTHNVLSAYQDKVKNTAIRKLEQFLTSETYNRPYGRKVFNTLLSRAMGYNKSAELGLLPNEVVRVVGGC